MHYIEEGQLSGWKKNLIPNTKDEFINYSNGSIYAEDKDFLHRKDALGFISIDKNNPLLFNIDSHSVIFNFLN